MSVQDFIKDKSARGTHVSQGRFTLDLSKAADKLSASALPSEHHYLLKMVQLANRLQTEKIELRIGRAETEFTFQVSQCSSPVCQPEFVAASMANPLQSKDSSVQDLVSALLGTFHPHNKRVTWYLKDGLSLRILTINEKRDVELWNTELKEAVDGIQFCLEIQHRNSWKFWQSASRRANTASIVRQHCAFSAARIFIDNRELETPISASLNDHVREIGGGQFNAIVGAFETTQTRVPASSISFDLAQEGEPALSVLRPSLSSYVVRQDCMNLWAQGTKSNNTLRPDGQSSSAWMLHFRQDGKDISLRLVRKRDRYRAILVMNIHGAGNTEPLRLKIVRHGVLVLDSQAPTTDTRLDQFQGCVLVLADDRIETDLSGLQLVQNEQFVDRITECVSLLEAGLDYFTRGESLMTFV